MYLKKVQVSYAENYKTLLSQRIEYKCSWTEKPNILKMSVHQVHMYIKYNSSQNPSEFFFLRQARLLYDLYGKAQVTAKTVLTKSAWEGIPLADVKACCPAAVTECMWY